MIDLNTVEKHKTLYKQWKERFEELVRKLLGEGKKVVLVAMSRKMPRLIERVNQLFPEGDLKNFQFVSEHVLPYILNDFKPERECIVIADDAMYYGSTINRISGYIRAITGQKPYVCPVVLSNAVGELTHAELYKMDNQIINVENIPFLTTHNAEWIIRLCRPIDVEFPILHFNISSAQKNEENKIIKILEKHFKDSEIYPIKHIVYDENGKQIPIHSYNVLPKKGTFFDRWNKDFCKMRFFVSDQKVQVVAYAPGILPEDILADTYPLFSDERIQQLWKAIQSYEVKSWPNVLPEKVKEDPFVDRIKKAYLQQCTRSKIIWANYLASFLYILEEKDDIVKVLSEVYGKDTTLQAEISEIDTRLLLPIEKVKTITDTLTRCFKEGRKEKSFFNGLHSSVLADQELVPEEYLDDYSNTVNRGLQRCRTVDEALSVVFSNQHFFINNGLLTNDALQRTQRLDFGITYTALENKLSFPIGIKGLWSAIHRWIDKNIDEGTVKPKYERVEIESNAYWLRMFRAGENEDSYTKQRRLCEFVIERLQHKEIRGYVKRNTVDDLLTLAWEDPCNIVNYRYKWDVFDMQRNDVAYQLTSNGHSFLDFMIDQGYLQDITDQEGFSRVSYISDKQLTTPLSFTQEQAISDYVDAYYYYVNTRYQPYIMNNFFPQNWEENSDKYKKSISIWCRQFAEFIHNYVIIEERKDSLLNNYYDLNETLSRIIYHSMKATDIAMPENKNRNWQIIVKYLQKEESENFILFKEKLLSTAIVQEVFNQSFLVPEGEKEPVEIIEGYLLLVQEETESVHTILSFLHMNASDRAKKENQQEVVAALQRILLKNLE